MLSFAQYLLAEKVVDMIGDPRGDMVALYENPTLKELTQLLRDTKAAVKHDKQSQRGFGAWICPSHWYVFQRWSDTLTDGAIHRDAWASLKRVRPARMTDLAVPVYGYFTPGRLNFRLAPYSRDIRHMPFNDQLTKELIVACRPLQKLGYPMTYKSS